MDNKPFLCRIGLHKRYRYLPKVSGDLGETSIACERCGYGLSYFANTWNIEPKEVQDSIAKQAEIEYGHVLGMLRGISNPLHQMEMAFNIIKDKFSMAELTPIKEDLEGLRQLQDKI